jgi:hypothetical protein
MAAGRLSIPCTLHLSLFLSLLGSSGPALGCLLLYTRGLRGKGKGKHKKTHMGP